MAILERDDGERVCVGLFSLHGESAAVPVTAPDGRYENLIDGSEILVENGTSFCAGKPVIFTYRH